MEPEKVDIILPTSIDPRAAATADTQAADALFADYRSRVDDDTLRRQEADLALFAHFLGVVQAVPAASAPALGARLPFFAQTWSNVSHGLVAAFIRWQLQEGYAIGSINVRLATVRRYCALANAAGVIPNEAFALIRTVRGYSGRQARAIDAQRQRNSTPTRVGAKKARPRVLSPAQVATLKQQPTHLKAAVMPCSLRCWPTSGCALANWPGYKSSSSMPIAAASPSTAKRCTPPRLTNCPLMLWRRLAPTLATMPFPRANYCVARGRMVNSGRGCRSGRSMSGWPCSVNGLASRIWPRTIYAILGLPVLLGRVAILSPCAMRVDGVA